MRLPSRATSTPVGGAPGTLMFSSVPAGKRRVLELGDQARRERRRHREVEGRPDPEVELAGARLLRDRDPGQPEHDRLERRGHRARVSDVVAEVRAVVDPRHDQLGLEALDQPQVGQAHAVDRRAVGGVADRPVVEVDLLRPTAAAAS